MIQNIIGNPVKGTRAVYPKDDKTKDVIAILNYQKGCPVQPRCSSRTRTGNYRETDFGFTHRKTYWKLDLSKNETGRLRAYSFTPSMSVYHISKTKVDNHLTEIKQETETENHKLSQVPQSYNSLKYECMRVNFAKQSILQRQIASPCLQEKGGTSYHNY